MTKNKKLDAEDSALFRSAMRDVKPLTHTKVSMQKKPPTRVMQRRDLNEDNPDISFAFSDYEKLEPVKSEDFLEFARSGVQHKVLRKMRQGQYNAEAILDLHGKTTAEARECLAEFLLQCEQQDIRHVLVIHGKGRHDSTPVLKNKLNHWLREVDQIIAFCTALAKHGGSGALYVLLRRKH